jgi:hypothetical protein
MFNIITVLLAVLWSGSISVLTAGQAVKPLPHIEVTAANDVANLRELNDALSTLSEKVTACVKAGRTPEVCQCSYPENLASLRTRYAKLIQQHPEWKDQLLSYQYVNKEGRNISGTLVLQNLARQLEVLKCK